MINLIPKEEKKRMARDFYARILVMFFNVFSLAIIIGSTALIPAYWLSFTKQKYITSRLNHQSYMPVPSGSQDLLEVAKSLNDKFTAIDHAKATRFLVSERVIQEIIHHQSSGIKIYEISFTTDLVEGRKISIRGSADSRDKLLSFSRALGEDKNFKKVDLPISNFIKGSDIQFYITLIPS